MILVDVNVLIYAIDSGSPHHVAAHLWWNQQLSQIEPVGLSWAVILSVVRITTNPRIALKPLAAEDAMREVESWLAQSCVKIVQPGEGHWAIFRSLLQPLSFHPNLIMDAHLAALAMEHGGELCSTDEDFKKFPRLRWRNPLKTLKT